MNILVVNDDGIDAIGIEILAKALMKYGEVTIVSPDRGRSAASHSIVLHRPIEVTRVEKFNGITSYKISGVPADCVRVGIGLLDTKFDIVFSGVNNGLNLGTDILYSGTCAAAREGVIEGVAGVAISTDVDQFDIVLRELDSLLELVFNKRLYSKDYMLNINFPVKGYDKSLGYKLCRMGDKIFTTCFKELGNNLYMDKSYPSILDKNEGTDVYEADCGYITLVPVGIDQTNKEALEKLKL